MAKQRDVLADLVEEGDEIDALVAELGDAEWGAPTPAEGWTIAHQIAHLTMVFELAEKAAADAPAFEAKVAGLGPSFDAAVQQGLYPYLADGPARLLDRWRTQRAATEQALFAVGPGQIVPWLVRPIPAAVLTAAGMMETFAHGQDVADTLGVRRTFTDRILHIAEFAVTTWDFGYQSRELTAPPTGFRFRLTAPSGEVWEMGPAEARELIEGPAVDLCLLATRRRHRADLALTATGPESDRWLDIAQAYRGPAGPGRRPGQFTEVPG
ncbi:TIGR03084 family metal-binding protein (plasmid) [Streptomyces sp. NBC_00846]|uniref:TIGR03084 family metal-binding protein n=1 Tax=Streptomyces sp. NBC_00846 TaxID=2975849 RepID=UPI002F91B8C8|nr:TIGR03084 family metal-binding protein [Streptomyces sp. NBC_00846]